MSQAKLGIQMIDMYCTMIRQDFPPLLDVVKERRKRTQDKVHEMVLADFHILPMWREREKLQARLEVLNNSLKPFDQGGHNSFSLRSSIDNEVAERMSQIPDDADVIINVQKDMARAIRLSGLHGDAKAVFDSLVDRIADLKKKLNIK